jgi:hypothetical protein
MTIQLVDAAKFFKDLPHQREAWEWLQTAVPNAVIEEFGTRYRTEAKPINTNNWEGVYELGRCVCSGQESRRQIS